MAPGAHPVVFGFWGGTLGCGPAGSRCCDDAEIWPRDFVPVHVERLSRRLALGMDGISLAYTCSANGACGGSATRSGLNVHGGRAQTHAPMQDDSYRTTPTILAGCSGGRSGVHSSHICLACRMPCFSECPKCEAHWCDQCRGVLEFCPMCGSSDDELDSDEDEHSGGVWRQRCCLAIGL